MQISKAAMLVCQQRIEAEDDALLQHFVCVSKSGSLTHSFAGEPDGVPDWPNGVHLSAGYVVPRTGGHGVVRV